MKTEAVHATLARMGCYRIWIGSESGSQRILDAMQRGVTVQEVHWATQAAQRHGIEVGMFLMWGYDGETIDDIEATIDHVKASNPDIFFTTVAYPIKNTGFFNKVSDRLTIRTPWRDATDRDYVIAGQHSKRYYSFADDWLRAEVAAHRLMDIDPTGAESKRTEAAAARASLVAASTERNT